MDAAEGCGLPVFSGPVYGGFIVRSLGASNPLPLFHLSRAMPVGLLG